MAKHLSALAAAVPPELGYDFFPQTWQLPSQLSAFLAAAKAAGKKQAFIVKPDAGCQVCYVLWQLQPLLLADSTSVLCGLHLNS